MARKSSAAAAPATRGNVSANDTPLMPFESGYAGDDRDMTQQVFDALDPEELGEFEENDAPLDDGDTVEDGEIGDDLGEDDEYDDLGDDGEEDADSDSEEEQLWTVKIDGEESQVTEDELIRGYQTTQAANKRLREAAELRKQWEPMLHETAQAREILVQQIHRAEQVLTEMVGDQTPNWDELRAKLSPADFAAHYADHQRQQEQLGALRARRAQEEQRLYAERQALFASFVDQQRARLPEVVPEWADEGVRDAEIQEIKQYLLDEYGFDESDLNGVVDPRLMKIIRNSWRHETRSAKAQRGEKKIRARAESAKRMAPGARTRKSGNTASRAKRKRVEQASDRLNRSGRATDAASIVEMFLDD